MGHYVSFVIQSWQDDHDSTMSWRVRCVRDPEPLHFPDGSFVVRTWIDDEDTVRGLIRHVQSGREMQFQSGKNALEFIHAWMNSSTPPADLESDSRQKGPADG